MKILFSILLLLLSFQTYAVKDEITDILLINSYHTGYKWTDRLTQGVIDGFGQKDKYRIFVEYMDAKRFNDSTYFKELESLFKIKYQTNNIEGIILADNYAFQYFLQNGDSIWSKATPKVFCGVNNIDSIKYNTKEFKGVREDIDIKNTLRAIKKLHPQTDTLVVISDQSLSGQIFYNQVVFEINKNRIPYISIDATKYNNLSNSLRTLNPHNKIIILLNLYVNKQSIPIEIHNFGKDLLTDKHIPIYSFWDFLLGDFIVGGSLISSYYQGFDAAKILKKRLINDSSVKSLYPTRYSFIFDNKVLTKYNIDNRLLPSNSLIINEPVSFWVKHKQKLIIVSIILLVLIISNLLMIYNIIVRKRIESKLQSSEKRLELALNSANEGLWDYYNNQDEIYINLNLAKLLGYDSEKDININLNNWESFIYPEDLPQLQEVYEQNQYKKTSAFNFEVRIIRKDKSIGWYALHGSVTELDSQGIPTRVTGILLDINTQKEFEDALKKAKDRAEESDRLKSSFLANMSHEIRTPMNAILGFSDIVTEQQLSKEEQGTYLNQIKYSAEKLLNIINDIVDISKIESGQLDIRNEAIFLDSLMDNIKIIGKSLLKDKPDVKIKLEKEASLREVKIYIDPFRLEQILLNLLSNAVKNTHKGLISIRYYTKNNNTIFFEVKDTGEGIAKEYQEIIFERFRQVDAPSKKLMSGTGLGLSICRSLSKLMKGNISVFSELDKGSTFTIEFPLNIVTQDKIELN